jgi:holo-[acyl-carrier protein] synthase
MIVGTGVDIVEIDRVRKAHRKHGVRFLERFFTDEEIRYCLKKKDPYPSMAGRFAAKEAVLKAFGGDSSGRGQWNLIEVTRASSGKPGIRLRGIFEKTRRKKKITLVHLSISHGKRDAVAWVVFESKAKK